MRTRPISLDNEILLCPNPNCGHSETHHDRVEVFDRIEDAPTGRHVLVQNRDQPGWIDTRTTESSRVTVDDNLTGNPSTRRGGVLIHLWCEACGERFRLGISQHKGLTLVELVT